MTNLLWLQLVLKIVAMYRKLLWNLNFRGYFEVTSSEILEGFYIYVRKNKHQLHVIWSLLDKGLTVKINVWLKFFSTNTKNAYFFYYIGKLIVTSYEKIKIIFEGPSSVARNREHHFSVKFGSATNCYNFIQPDSVWT